MQEFSFYPSFVHNAWKLVFLSRTGLKNGVFWRILGGFNYKIAIPSYKIARCVYGSKSQFTKIHKNQDMISIVLPLAI